MKTNPLAKRYARALFQLADEKDQLDSTLQELNDFNSILQEQKLLRALLLTPSIEKSNKEYLLRELLTNKVSPLFLHFVLLLLEKSRFEQFPNIVETFHQLYDQKHYNIHCYVTSAAPLSETDKHRVLKTLGGEMISEIILHYQVDPEILGGFKVEMQENVIDATLKRRMNELLDSLGMSNR